MNFFFIGVITIYENSCKLGKSICNNAVIFEEYWTGRLYMVLFLIKKNAYFDILIYNVEMAT